MQTILITGATDGLGRALAGELAKRDAHVLMHGRDDARGRATIDAIRTESGKPNRADLVLLRELIEADQVRPTVDRVYPLAEIADALEAIGEGHVQGKLVVRID